MAKRGWGANWALTDILIVSDGKAGHRNQSLGLAEALVRLGSATTIEQMAPLSRYHAVMALIFGRLPWSREKPRLIVGAGHGTHLTMLALKRCWRVPVIVLMKPSLPFFLFDLCLIPEHDSPPSRGNVAATRGALNRIRPGVKVPGSGLVLVGGPSRNNDWDETQLAAQVDQVCKRSPGSWTVATSRRTPASTVRRLESLTGIELVLAENTTPDWLPKKLATAGQCWVTEDSVSMVYEALTAGCAVGLLPVPWRREGRLLRGVNALKGQGLLTPFERWSGEPLPAPLQILNEADRCADIVRSRGLI
ncbi:hypothetical protein DET61_11092 [Marinobacter nauticus]|uniref:Nucleoside-diphosphate sugar epimerase n=1 Tax=Marinobacter nauticus TaxID=2743 RepID=A0A368XKI6_MARNT|nr:mitochondrial fission ELM1 family protein [Marinobacter nauticus]RCW66544.1 hypothetical protein DET61_11092 [Marinobacter nauticus]